MLSSLLVQIQKVDASTCGVSAKSLLGCLTRCVGSSLMGESDMAVKRCLNAFRVLLTLCKGSIDKRSLRAWLDTPSMLNILLQACCSPASTIQKFACKVGECMYRCTCCECSEIELVSLVFDCFLRAVCRRALAVFQCAGRCQPAVVLTVSANIACHH
jgi:hypothetical protein